MTSTMKKNRMDLTTGPIFKKLFLYAVPFIFSSLLQTSFSSIDITVLGIMVSDQAVAAVGANTALNFLIVNLFTSFAVGANIVTARYVGARDEESIKKTIGTSLIIAIVGGFILLAIGVPLASVFLNFMDCAPEILPMATTYLRIYFLGTPIMMLYNFSASILRATGDTKRPLIFLSIGGVANVLFNIVFILLGFTVEGVAIGTVLSQLIATILTLRVLFKKDGPTNVSFKNIKFYKEQFKEIIAIGIPSSIQTFLLNVSNVLIQLTVNSLGGETMSASTAAYQFDGIILSVGTVVASSVSAFIAQNVGAKNVERVKKSIFYGLLLAVVLQVGLGVLATIFAKPLCAIIVNEKQTIELAATRLTVMGLTLFLCGIMEVLTYSIRAMGKSFLSLIINFVSSFAIRILALKILFYFFPKFHVIFFSYSVGWVITILICVFVIPVVYKELKKKLEN